MPQKACERGFCHVMAISFKLLQKFWARIEDFHFRVFFCLKKVEKRFSTFLCSKYLKYPIFLSDTENGAFQIFRAW